MIQFPENLIPNFITVAKLPIAPIATLTPGVALLTNTIALTDTPCGGSLILNYTTQPTRTENITGSYNPITGQCSSIELGWVEAWKFFSQTLKSGRLKFEIPSTSPVWKRIDYLPEWLDISHSGQSSLWRVTAITNDNGANDLRQLTKFTITIRHEIRTKKWI